jgi:predicted dehydrogenase
VVTGTEGRIEVRYDGGETAPWADLEHVTVTTASSGTRTVMGPATEHRVGLAEFPSMLSGTRVIARRFAEAVRDGGQPMATGADGLRILEATVGAYQSGATGETVSIPLDRSSPVFERGAFGVADLPQAPWSPLDGTDLFR